MANNPSPARLVVVTDILTPYFVGVMEALASTLDVAVVFCAKTGSRASDWQLDPPRGFESQLAGGLTIGRGSPNGTDLHVDPRILAAIARRRPDVVVTAGFSVPSVYAAAAAKANRAPLLIYSDGTSISEARFGRGQMLARRLLLPLAFGAIALSRPAAARFRELGVAPDRVFLAPHSTDIGPLHAVGRARRYQRSSKFKLLGVGRLIPKKGFLSLVEAVALARRQGTDVELTIAGAGPDDEMLRARATALEVPLKMRGFVARDGLPALFAEADAFAFPSLREPYGISLLEAAASGLPSVASPFAGATEDLVVDGVSGLRCSPYETATFAHAIARLAEDPALRERLGRAAHAATVGRTPAAAATGYVNAITAALTAAN